MPISALPTPPSRSDAPQDFSDRADALLGALPGFVTEANALQSGVNAKEASASSYATIATDKAAEAQASATTASTKASEAAASAVAAAAAASNAEIAFDSFDDKYLGSKASDPATDNDGNALLTGALYWNTSVGAVRVWNGSSWLSMAADASIVDFQQAGAGAIVRTVQDKLRGLVAPEDFGAVGDGVANDELAFEKLNAHLLAIGGGKVEARRYYNLPNGFTITADNVTLDGCGTGRIYSSGNQSHAVYSQNTENITIENLSIYIPRTNLRTGGFCMLFDGCDFVTVRGCKTDGGVVGLWSINCNDVLVESCHIDTPKADGVHFGHGSNRCKAIGNTVLNQGDDAFSVTYYAGFDRPTDIVIANNIAIGGVWGYGASVYSADRVVITGNTFQNMPLGGVNLYVHDGGAICSDVVVSGNNIDGSNRAEKQPESYWFGTDPALDPAVTSPLHSSSFVISGQDVLVEGNKISFVSSTTGLSRRGMTLDGGSRITISNNSFTDVNGDGVNCGTVALSQLCIDRNTFESVLGIAIRSTVSISESLSICGNTQGYGAVSGEPYMISLTGTGSTLAMINNNSSSGGRGIQADGLNPLAVFYNNTSGKKSTVSYTPTVTATQGSLASVTVNTARFHVVEELVFIRLDITITNNGTGADAISVTLPIAGTGNQHLPGRETVLTGESLIAQVTAGSLIIRGYDNSYPGGTNARIAVTGVYERS